MIERDAFVASSLIECGRSGRLAELDRSLEPPARACVVAGVRSLRDRGASPRGVVPDSVSIPADQRDCDRNPSDGGCMRHQLGSRLGQVDTGDGGDE